MTYINRHARDEQTSGGEYSHRSDTFRHPKDQIEIAKRVASYEADVAAGRPIQFWPHVGREE